MKKLIQRGLLIFPILKDLNKADGILVKNEGIRKGFQQNGVEVDVLEYTSKGIYNREQLIYPLHSNRFRRVYQYNITAWKKIQNYILNNQYDFIWFRVPLINASVARFVKSLKESKPECKIILEYGAYPYVNELTRMRRMFYNLNKQKEMKMHRFADFVITYCGQERVDNLLNIPINNGIDLQNIPVVQTGVNLSKRINFISVSSLKLWHAYERFIVGLSTYVQQPDTIPVHFNIVGNGPEHDKLKSLAKELNLESFITFHSFKVGKELDEIYQQNHAAIGTLGFHRIGISNSSSLKNREYFARGLPIILSTPDLDMPATLPFVQYVPVDESPIDIAAVVSFVQEVYKVPNLNQEIRKYAEQQVAWTSKIKTVLAYLMN